MCVCNLYTEKRDTTLIFPRTWDSTIIVRDSRVCYSKIKRTYNPSKLPLWQQRTVATINDEIHLSRNAHIRSYMRAKLMTCFSLGNTHKCASFLCKRYFARYRKRVGILVTPRRPLRRLEHPVTSPALSRRRHYVRQQEIKIKAIKYLN